MQEEFRLIKLFKHEGYSQLRNDVALLQLERPISASSQVNTVCLPGSGSRVPAGTQCYITGKESLRGRFSVGGSHCISRLHIYRLIASVLWFE